MRNKLTEYILKKIKIFIIVASIFFIFYLISRTIFLFYPGLTLVEKILSALLLLCEMFFLVHAFGYMTEIFKLSKKGKEIEDFDLRSTPPVAVIVATKDEPTKILKTSLLTLQNLDYPNKKIYILDDSTKPECKKEADELSKRFGLEIFRREEKHGAKAGIINDFIKNMPEKYLAIFDVDQNPMPDFLKKTIPILEKDKKLAFVQTPQCYTNIGKSPIALAAEMQQAIFYESICEGKNISNAMFCCGTNVVFRKIALIDVGGFDETSITEDFATSVKIHLQGYKSLYYNHVSAFGMAPTTLNAYFKQQTRWAMGTIGVFKKLIRYLFKKPTGLSFMQWLEYFLAGTYYFIGWVFFLLMLFPIIFLMFGIPSYFLAPEVYIGTFLPYFLLSLLILYSSMLERNYVFSQIYKGVILGLLSFPILMKSALYALIGKKTGFVVTPKGRGKKTPLVFLWPYMVMISLNIIAIAFGTMKFLNNEAIYAVSVNILWATYHVFILSHIFYFNNPPKT